MDIRQILIDAQKAVDESGISDDLRQLAFQKAVDALSRADQAPVVGPSGIAHAKPAADVPAGSGSEKITRRLGIAAEVVGEIYSDNESGGVDVVLGVGKLDSSTATATKQIALLVAGARQLTGSEEWTDTKVIRAVCSDFGRFDSANFAKTVRQMDDAFSFRGKGQQLTVRLHQRGIEKLKQLITSATGT
ncbi:MAG: hypothetical protein ABR526_13000 [Chthoniobacterales bacterium]